MMRRKLHLLAAAFAAATLLAGCGGGDDDAGPRVPISRVVVAGDSLADSGTFGARFTVQNSADVNAPFPVFSEIVAQNFGVRNECPFFVATSATTVVNNPQPGCTNFAVGGGRIRLHTTDATPDLQQTSVPFQLATAGQVIGTYTATDLVLVDGGGNDAADLVTAFLGAAGGTAAGIQNYQAFLSQQLDAATIQATLPQPNGGAIAAGLYMQRLADTYYDAIKVNALDRGATHVAVLNMPDVTVIPALQPALALVSNSAGGGANGAAAAAQFQATVRTWLNAFNSELAARVGGDTRVAIVPFFADLNEEVANPVDFGLTNVTTPACNVIGVNAGATCTSAALDAAPPAGLTAGWWKTFAFADPLHPTPFGHQLLAASVNRALARAGFL